MKKKTIHLDTDGKEIKGVNLSIYKKVNNNDIYWVQLECTEEKEVYQSVFRDELD